MFRTPNGARAWKVVSASCSALCAASLLSRRHAVNDADPRLAAARTTATTPVNWDSPTLIWGSNKGRLIAPELSTSEVFRSPAARLDMILPALRDLVLHQGHGALVDARGDVYQWGDAHFGEQHSAMDNREPMLSLQGKDIISVTLSPDKIYALSRSGRVYVVPVSRTEQRSTMAPPGWLTWFFGTPNIQHGELKPATRLTRNETFTSISAGNDHMLALTSIGRVFCHPISARANAFGQLGLRKARVHCRNSETADGLLDTNGLTLDQTSPQALSTPINDKSIAFCSDLYEIPSLREVKVAQAVAGGRSSFVRTVSDGRVLAWGANDFGQLGLGSQTALPFVTVPTEVILSRYTPVGTRVRCASIAAGGDLAYFITERSSPRQEPSVDVLAAGCGQWGALGNGVFSTAQAEPLRIRAISGLTEYSESLKRTVPIGISSLVVSPAPSGHALLALDTVSRAGPGALPKRDLFVWGNNQSCQLGNGAKKNLSVPTNLFSIGANELEDGRVLLGEKMAKVIDMQGNVWKKATKLQQTVVAGYDCTMVYWKITEL
ncbi:RCC1/BLIP-II [Auriculariales sp. MPI-PUGE-AT-0066]|nr:RCC1/BLIP-II [Auriculariales sp. MPI-PUGE-AT-0066]